MFFPGMVLLATVLAFNLIGDAMQDALNPRPGGTDLAHNQRNRTSRPSRKGTIMRSTTRWLFALVAAAAPAFGVSACGSDDDESDSSSEGAGIIPDEFVGPTEAPTTPPKEATSR